jgi:excisionase family DNA binding protein
MKRLLTADEVDELLNLRRGRAARWAKAGKIPFIRLPDGDIRFSSDAIAEALAAWLVDTVATQGVPK